MVDTLRFYLDRPNLRAAIGAQAAARVRCRPMAASLAAALQLLEPPWLRAAVMQCADAAERGHT